MEEEAAAAAVGEESVLGQKYLVLEEVEVEGVAEAEEAGSRREASVVTAEVILG